MMIKYVWLFLVTALLPSTQAVTNYSDHHEAKLVRNLLKGYNTNVRPVARYQDVLRLRMDLTILQILDVDERNQIILGSFWLDLFWKDVFLQWDPVEYGGIRHIRIYPNRLWRPDLFVYNDVSVDKQDVEDLYRVLVAHDGNITWRVPIIYRVACQLDMTYYPWDRHLCPIIFKSWILQTDKLDLNSSKPTGTKDLFIGDGEWDLMSFNVNFTNVEVISNEQVQNKQQFVTYVTYILELERKPLFSFYNLILPSIFIVFCTYLVFLLPPESGEKVSMAVTMLLSTTVFLLLVAEYLPAQSDVIPVISKYFLAAIVLLVMTTACTVMVLYIRFNGSLKINLPVIADKVILEWLATIVGMRKKVLQIMESTEFTAGHIKTFIDDDSEELENRAYLAWVMAAMVLDRLCLIVFTLGTAILTLTLMTYHPIKEEELLPKYKIFGQKL